MPQFNVREARDNLSKLLGMALCGEEVVIARHGRPIASLSAIRTSAGDRMLGAGRGSVTILSEDWRKSMSDHEADAFWAGRG